MKHRDPKPADKDLINRYKIAHMVGVAEYMHCRARAYGLNPDLMYTLGLLHDIGYLQGRYGHEVYGGVLLRELGVYQRYTDAVFNHGDISTIPVEELTKEQVLLVEADSCIGKEGYYVGPEDRIAYVKREYGTTEPMVSNIRKVKEFCRINGIDAPFMEPDEHGRSR